MGKGKRKCLEKGSLNKQERPQNELKRLGKKALAVEEAVSKRTEKKGIGSDQSIEKSKEQQTCNKEHLENISDFEDDSESISESLGEKDTMEEQTGDQSSNATSAEISVVPETVPSNNGEMETKRNGLVVKPTFASLFAGNRQASNGSKLQQMDVGKGYYRLWLLI